MKERKLIKQIDSGVFIPLKILHEVGLDKREIELELHEYEIRILPTAKINIERPFTKDASLWSCVGIGETNFNGRDHDTELYK